MRVQTGWYDKDTYFEVKPLKNGNRQELIVCAERLSEKRWNICAGVFSTNTTYNSFFNSDVWEVIASTNKNPSLKVLSLGLEALTAIEEEIQFYGGEGTLLYIDGMDKRRQRVYTKILTKNDYGYKQSKTISKSSGMPLLYKRV